MDARYNVYFAGQLQAGQQLVEVRARLAKLFNADQNTLDKLFSGKPQLLKRDCDEATALKYKQAMERAGAVPIVRPVEPPAAAQPAAPQPATPTQAADRPMTTAERIAALAAAPDDDRFRGGESEARPASPPPSPAAGQPAEQSESPPVPASGGPELAPPGSDLLQPGEQQRPPPREVDTSALEIGEQVDRLAPVPPPPPPPPDTTHLDMGEVGETIPGLPGEPPAPPPDVDDIDLAPVGSDIGEPNTAQPPAPAPDLTGLDMAPVGTDVLEEKYRRRDTAQPPPTDHIQLEE